MVQLETQEYSTPQFPWRAVLPRAILAGAVLLASGFISRAIFATQSPFELMVDQATRLLPPSLFAFLLRTLLYWGKPTLLLGLSAGWLLLGVITCIISGFLVWKRGFPTRQTMAPPSRWISMKISLLAGLVPWLLGALVIAPVSGFGLLGSSTLSGPLRFSGALLTSSLAFGLAMHYSLGTFLLPSLNTLSASAGTAPETLIPRREFLGKAMATGVIIVGGIILSRAVADLLANARRIANPGGPGGVLPEVTPTEQFYVVSKNISDPVVSVDDWALEVKGLVEQPLRFSYQEFKALPFAKEHVTLECISNQVGGDLISNALWTGVPLKEVLRRSGIQSGAHYLLSFAADGYSESLPLERAMQDDILLAYEMNSAPLTDKHGFPLRLLIPGRYGMKGTKWLSRLEVAAEDRPGFWEQRGWDEEAVAKTMSRVDSPRKATELPLGVVTVGGIAFAGSRGIRRLEVSADGGKTWQDAKMRPALSPYTWVLWEHSWEPSKTGVYGIQARATDGTGAVQTAEVSGDFPSGATGYHTITLRLF